MAKFENITKYIPLFEDDEIGTWITDTDDDGDEYSYVDYSDLVNNFMDDLYELDAEYPELRLTRYIAILQQNGIDKDNESLSAADVSQLDERCILSLLIAAVRSEKFEDGALMGFFENGCIKRWLERLKELD